MGNRVLGVIVSYNSARVLSECLESFDRERSAALHLDIVVVDNASIDDSCALVDAMPDVELKPCHSNLGYGAAINTVMPDLVDYDYLLVANPDVRFLAGSLQGLLSKLNSGTSELAAVGPMFVDSEGAPDATPNGRSVVPPMQFVRHLLGSRLLKRSGTDSTARYFGEVGTSRDCDWLSGACLLIRADAFRAVGGFNSRYFLYFEDVVLGCALRSAGYRLRYEPSIKVEHTAGRSSTFVRRARTELFKKQMRHVRSAIRFYSSDYRTCSRKT